MDAKTFHGQATCILDAQGRFVNVSPSLAAFFSMDGRKLQGRTLISCMEPSEAEQVEPLLVELGRGEPAAYRFQVRLLGHGRTPTWVTLHLAPGGTDPEGHPLLVAVFEEPPRAS